MIERTPIELERVLLRPPTLEDAEMVYRNWGTDAEVTKFVVWRPHASIEDTRAFLVSAREAWEKGTEFTWLICLKNNGEPIGAISLRKHEFMAGIGYVLSRRHWGRGLTSEAARRVLAIAFSDPRIVCVRSYCDVENARSARVLEKLGMTLEGTLRSWLVHPTMGEKPRDCLSYSIVRSP
jgi:ribosomal-protein-alanine N-acetyltransferase